MEVGLLLLILVIAGLSAYGANQISDRNVKTWKSVAQELGLSFEGNDRKRTIHGELDGVSVRATYERQVGQQWPPLSRSEEPPEHPLEQVTFFGAEHGCIPASLVVRRDSATRLLGLRFGARDLQLGDPQFDELVELPALDAWACAALSHAARQQLSRFVKLGGEVQQGVLRCALDGSAEHERDSLLAMLQFSSQLGKALTVTRETLCQRLSDNALHDPNHAVRWRNLRFLAAAETRAPLASLTSTARALLTDPNGAVRTLAARQLGAEGFDVLRAEAADTTAHHEVRAEALRALAEQRAPDLEPIVRAVLEAPSPAQLLSAALTIAAEQRLTALSGAVARCAEHRDEGVRRAAAVALGALGGGEPELLRLVDDDSASVQQAALEALAKSGSVRAVEPLLPLARSLLPSPLRDAARAAIAQIQARLGHVEAGRVSLADQQQLLVGALDLADVSVSVRAGELSLVDDVNTSDAGAEQLSAPEQRRSDMS